MDESKGRIDHPQHQDGTTLVWNLFTESASSWMAHKAPKMGAALAYYTAFSLAPVVILVLSVVSLFMKRDEAVRRVVAQMSDLVGAEGGRVVQDILGHAGSTTALSWGTIISLLILWISASGAFGELQDSLNAIWEVPNREVSGLKSIVKNRLISLSMVFVLGFFMLTSLLISTFIAAVVEMGGFITPKVALFLLNLILSLIIASGLFATLFKLLPDVELTWRDVIPGALLTGVLFIVGKFALALYIAHSAFASMYGEAASFMVILFWVFYSAQILYFGAEFTRVWCRSFGSHRELKDRPPLKK